MNTDISVPFRDNDSPYDFCYQKNAIGWHKGDQHCKKYKLP